MLKLQYFGHLIWRANSLEKTIMLGKIESRRRGWGRQSMRWLASFTISMDTVWISSGKGQGSLVCCSPWAHKLDTAVCLNNNNKAWTLPVLGTRSTLQVLENSLAHSSAPFWKSDIHAVSSFVSFMTVFKTPLFNEVEPYLQLQTLKHHYFSHIFLGPVFYKVFFTFYHRIKFSYLLPTLHFSIILMQYKLHKDRCIS